MNSIEVMVKEHDNILRFIKAMRNAGICIMDGNEVCVNDFRDAIDFVRNYADKHHHGKEEEFLFKEMVNHLGSLGKNLITHGMLVEHDLGRLYIAELEEALNQYSKHPSSESKVDIVANTICYTKLLKRHIDKENEVVYTYAEKNLPSDVLEDINEKSEEFEKRTNFGDFHEKYTRILKNFEYKYK